MECSLSAERTYRLLSVTEPLKDKDGNVILVQPVVVEEPVLEVRERPFQLQNEEEFPIVLVKEDDPIVKKD